MIVERRPIQRYAIQPVAPNSTSALWVDTSENSTLKYYDGNRWVPVVSGSIPVLSADPENPEPGAIWITE